MSEPKSVSVDSSLRSNQVLRRYLDLAKFVELLRTQSLYLRRTDLFTDKFEGSFTPPIKAAIEEAYKVNGIDFSYEKFKKELREGVYVNCWSLGVDDNMALWELYGRSEASVAITTTVGKLQMELQALNLPGHTCISKVEYIKHWHSPKIEIFPYSNIFRYKVVAYDFEKEVRIIHDQFEENFEQKNKETGVLLGVNLDRLLRSIVISPAAQPWFYDLVKDIAQRYGVKTPIKKSKLAIDPI